MSLRKFIGCVLSILMLAASAGMEAQGTKKVGTGTTATAEVPDGGVPRYIKPETPQQRMERLGTQEDPGPNPDSKTKWIRFGHPYTIHKFDKKWVRPTDRPGWVRPHPNLNLSDELYQENDKWVWVWIPDTAPRRTAEERRAATAMSEYSPTALQYLEKVRHEYEPLEPPATDTRIRFEEASTGLPASGSFRNSLAVADMDGDGNADIVLPSQRGSASGRPSIYLGDGKGGWKPWDVKWPHRIDYGSVTAADFNQDKKMDLAFGVHLKGVDILLGDGKGTFTVAHREPQFPSRRVVTTDVDGDGWTDVVAMWEGPLAQARELRGKGYSGLRAYLNREKGQRWEGMNLAGPRYGISGDWLAAGNFNGDKRPDFVGSSMFFNSTHTLFVSKGEGSVKYEPIDDPEALLIPGRGTYFAVTAAPFSSQTFDDAVVSSVRSWPEKLDPKLIPQPPLMHMTTIDRISFAGDKPKRTSIVRYDGARSITGLNHGDFDGDGDEDLIFTRSEPREAVLLLGDGKGNFEKAQIEGLALAGQRSYDVTVADVNADKRPDVVVMYEADSGSAFSPKNGAVQVFLNRGVGK
jgi:hypothetical protein